MWDISVDYSGHLIPMVWLRFFDICSHRQGFCGKEAVNFKVVFKVFGIRGNAVDREEAAAYFIPW